MIWQVRVKILPRTLIRSKSLTKIKLVKLLILEFLKKGKQDSCPGITQCIYKVHSCWSSQCLILSSKNHWINNLNYEQDLFWCGKKMEVSSQFKIRLLIRYLNSFFYEIVCITIESQNDIKIDIQSIQHYLTLLSDKKLSYWSLIWKSMQYCDTVMIKICA